MRKLYREWMVDVGKFWALKKKREKRRKKREV